MSDPIPASALNIEDCLSLLSQMVASPLSSPKEKLAAIDRIARLRGWYANTRAPSKSEASYPELDFQAWKDSDLLKLIETCQPTESSPHETL